MAATIDLGPIKRRCYESPRGINAAGILLAAPNLDGH